MLDFRARHDRISSLVVTMLMLTILDVNLELVGARYWLALRRFIAVAKDLNVRWILYESDLIVLSQLQVLTNDVSS